MEKRGKLVIAGMLFVIVVVIAVIINMPEPLMSKGPRPESNAISALRKISSSQELYSSRHETYATLEQLWKTSMIEKGLAHATTPVSAVSGYYYKFQTSGKAWCCTARPATFGVEGERNFMITNEGIIYFNTDENSSEFTEKLGG